MEDKVINGLRLAQTDEQLSELEMSVNGALKRYRGMSKEQIEPIRGVRATVELSFASCRRSAFVLITKQ
jgi:hypothetical protein